MWERMLCLLFQPHIADVGERPETAPPPSLSYVLRHKQIKPEEECLPLGHCTGRIVVKTAF
jgi:hypothetical protein